MTKKNIKLIGNCDAASDVIGALLLTSIAVLAFSTASVFILSTYQGAADTPHVDIDGWVDVESNVITLRHSGGEIVNSDDIRIILDVNGTHRELSPQEVRSIMGSNTWELGDTININASSLWATEIDEGDYIGAAIVHTASSVLVKSGTLLGDVGESGSGSTEPPVDPPTPSNQTFTPIWVEDTSGGSVTVEQVETDDEQYSDYDMPRKDDYDDTIYQQFNFSINSSEAPTQVIIRIIHKEHNSINGAKLKVWEEDAAEWHEYTGLTFSSTFHSDYVNVSDNIDTSSDINNLKVQYLAYATANNKETNIDYVAVNVSYS